MLGAISKSVADTAPVFEAILDACQRLFGSEEIGIYTIGDDDMVRVAAWRGPGPRKSGATSRRSAKASPGGSSASAARTTFPIVAAEPDLVPDRARTRRSASGRVAALCADAVGGPRPRLDPGRALAAKTLLGAGAGASAKLRRPGGDRDPERAAVQARPTEALQQQTATADVLKVIAARRSTARPCWRRSSIPCGELCGALQGRYLMREGEHLRSRPKRLSPDIEPTSRPIPR